MDVPGLVRSALDGEDVAASVPLRGEDALYLTPTRTVVYRGNSLLSDEAVEEYPHDAERVEVSEGRRKSTITLSYGLDGERTLTVPGGSLDDVLHTVLAGVFNGTGVTDPGETTVRTYRFSEMTLIVTSDRVVKHVGNAVWDEDYEQIHYDDVTGLDVEEGSVATQLVLETRTRPERIKTPTDRARDVREHVEEALLEYHGAASLEAFERERAAEAAAESRATDDADASTGADDARGADAAVTFDSPGLDPITTDGPDDVPGDGGVGGGNVDRSPASDPQSSGARDGQGAASGSEGDGRTDDADGFAGSAFETAVESRESDREALAERLRALDDAMERQEELLAEQRALVEELATELSRDR